MGIRWGRIVIGAMVLEVVLIALAVPLLPLVDNPLTVARNPAKSYTAFMVALSAIIFAAGAIAGWWVSRPLSSRFVLHGAATGLVATAIYIGLTSIPPNTIAGTIAAYTAFWFTIVNGIRIAGTILGAVYQSSRRSEVTR